MGLVVGLLDNQRMTSHLPLPTGSSLTTWDARLHLRFAARNSPSGKRTVLIENRHEGPLRVQKALYPEGEAVCQAIILHPPSGIAGGDQLTIHVTVDAEAEAQLTTPGAGKWYRSAGAEAAQRVHLSVAEGAMLEWLPQETLIFDGARAQMQTEIALAERSALLAWDILCLGRTAAGERLTQGHLQSGYRVHRNGKPLWIERGGVQGNDPLLFSPAGWAGQTVSATLMCTFPTLPQEGSALLAACRAVVPADQAQHGLTLLPGMLIARYLGEHSEVARQWLARLWEILRPVCCGRPAVLPRIWNT